MTFQSKQLENLLVFLSLVLTILLLLSYSQISLWQHDSAYYDLSSLFIKIQYEGRWLGPYLAAIFEALDGQISLFIDLLCLFLFFFIAAKYNFSHLGYAFVFAALCLQIQPFSHQLMWPASTAPAIVVLFLSSLLFEKLPLYGFYALFGVLFFALSSNFYYLLPLLHVGLLRQNSANDNFRVLILKIIPAWATGFIVGYLVMLGIVYLYTAASLGAGQFGLEIAAWRNPNPLQSSEDLIQNITKSAGLLTAHLNAFFSSPVSTICFVLAVGMTILSKDRIAFLIPCLLFLAMILAHYVITIPIGINIDIRTAIATWVGLIAMAFFTPISNSKQRVFKMALMVTLTLIFFIENKKNLGDYADISNFYYQDFLSVLPADYEKYDGVIFLGDNHRVYQANLKILRSQKFSNGKIVWLNTDTRWAPNAFKAGFDHVILCGTRDHRKPICQKLQLEDIKKIDQAASVERRINFVMGNYENFLVISLRPENL